MKPNFKLPTTKMCIVVWYRDGKMNETLIDTPFNNTALIDTMLMKHHVGYSELRAVKSVDPKAAIIRNFGRNF
jgi:hypothetical protein